MALSGSSLGGRAADRFGGQSKPVPLDSREGVRQAAAAVGLILVRSDGDPANLGPRPRGSAVVLRKEGVLVTNFHVVALDNSTRTYDQIFFNLPGDGVSALTASRRYRAKIASVSRDYDLALLRVFSDSDGNPLPAGFSLPSIELGDSQSVQLLDDIVIIGFPEKGGSTVTVNPGIVEGKDVVDNWIKSDARLIHGNSGGAAVNTEGKLIGIPTKVVLDQRLIDKETGTTLDNKGAYNSVGVGFLRPVSLVAAMLTQLDEPGKNPNPPSPAASSTGADTGKTANVIVRGVIKSAVSSKAIAGALAGLIPRGAFDVTATNLLTWGGTNADGEFEMNKPVAPGRYTMKVRALGYRDYIKDVDISEKGATLTIELSPSP